MPDLSPREHLRRLAETVPRAKIFEHAPMSPPYPTAAIAFALSRIQNEAYEMAGKQRNTNNSWQKIEFVNIRLDVEEGKKFRDWFKAQSEKIPDFIGQIMVDDHKVSCTWDDRNQCFIATFTGKEDQRHNDNKSLSSRSDDWYEALALNCYKHLVLCKGGKWEGETEKNNWG